MKSFVTTDGKYVVNRLSRWITVKHSYTVNKRNSLYDFSTDGNGYTPIETGYDPTNGVYLDYFRFCGRTYAINQFVLLGSMWFPEIYKFQDVDGEIHYLDGVDFCGNIYDPFYIECDEYGEKVRVYTVDRVKEV